MPFVTLSGTVLSILSVDNISVTNKIWLCESVVYCIVQISLILSNDSESVNRLWIKDDRMAEL